MAPQPSPISTAPYRSFPASGSAPKKMPAIGLVSFSTVSRPFSMSPRKSLPPSTSPSASPRLPPTLRLAHAIHHPPITPLISPPVAPECITLNSTGLTAKNTWSVTGFPSPWPLSTQLSLATRASSYSMYIVYTISPVLRSILAVNVAYLARQL